MKNITIVGREEYQDITKFEKITDYIYKALFNTTDGLIKEGYYVTTISFTLEEELDELEDRQYPLEDLLDKYLAHVSEIVQDDEDSPIMILELSTNVWLDQMEELITINGKRIYNKEVQKEGRTIIDLIIE